MGIKKFIFNKKYINIIVLKSLLKLILWIILCISLFIALLIFTKEKNFVINKEFSDPFIVNSKQYFTINQIRIAIGNAEINNGSDIANAYSWLNQHTKPGTFVFIDFSLLYFNGLQISSTLTPVDAWNLRWNNITLAYSYIFITFLIAVTGLIMLLIGFCFDYINDKKYRRYKLSNKYLTIPFFYQGFYFKNVIDFVLSLCMIFAFFNFISTLIVVAYMLLLQILNIISVKYKKFDVGINFNLSNSLYLLFVMLFNNAYLLLKGVLINNFGVNLDLLMALILPIGTITLIVGIFIKNLLSSKITSINKKIKTIDETYNTLNTFVILNKNNALADFNFVSILPKYFFKNLNDKKTVFVNIKTHLDLCKEIYDTKLNIKNKHYFIYLVLFECNDEDKFNEFKYNYSQFLNSNV